MRKSPWIIHYDASSCNGCDIETLACLTPLYDVERLGVINTGNPKHADIFLVTGAVNTQSRDVIRNIYHELPEPKVVIAVGCCASSGGIFRDCYNIAGGVDRVIPVDVYVPGCAARPEAIIDGVVQALGVLERKQAEMAALADCIDRILYLHADRADIPEILAMQKIYFQTEVELYGDDSIPALQQSMEEIEHEFVHGLELTQPAPVAPAAAEAGGAVPPAPDTTPPRVVFLKAVVNGKIIGSIRGFQAGDTAHVSRLIVHPYFRRRGIGRRLVGEMEKAFPTARRFEARTGHQSRRNHFQLTQNGYRQCRTEPFNPILSLVFFEKTRAAAADGVRPSPAVAESRS